MGISKLEGSAYRTQIKEIDSLTALPKGVITNLSKNSHNFDQYHDNSFIDQIGF